MERVVPSHTDILNKFCSITFTCLKLFQTSFIYVQFTLCYAILQHINCLSFVTKKPENSPMSATVSLLKLSDKVLTQLRCSFDVFPIALAYSKPVVKSICVDSK